MTNKFYLHITNPQWYALRDMVLVKERRIFPRCEMPRVDDRMAASLVEKGVLVAIAGDKYRITDQGVDAMRRVEALHERQTRD